MWSVKVKWCKYFGKERVGLTKGINYGPLWKGSGSTAAFVRSSPKRLFRLQLQTPVVKPPESRSLEPFCPGGVTKHQLRPALPHPPTFFQPLPSGGACRWQSGGLRREAGEGSRRRRGGTRGGGARSTHASPCRREGRPLKRPLIRGD
jgi:hypothetical protein